MSELPNSPEIEKYKNILRQTFVDIDPLAVGIIKKLKDSGFEGYLVGGGVRDLLVGLKPKDFDIATSALPNEVKRKVPYCFIIGRRFKLVHARRGDKIFEIATYRREATDEELSAEKMIDLPFSEENFFGNIKEDSFRRDFTVNALFYDPIAHELVDHCNGLQDITMRTLRMIGNPKERIKEDPIRILRAIRLSQKLSFSIESELRQSIRDDSEEIIKSVLPRRREEWLKFFRLPSIELALWELFDLHIFHHVLPTLHSLFEQPEKCEEFLSYIRKMSSLAFDLNDPVEIFGGILYSYLLAEYEHPLKIDINTVSESSKFQSFCKDELGIFKTEFIAIIIAIQHIHVLLKHDSYLKKGERRQKALLNNPHFNLALKLGLMSGELTATDYLFWMNEKERLLSEQT